MNDVEKIALKFAAAMLISGRTGKPETLMSDAFTYAKAFQKAREMHRAEAANEAGARVTTPRPDKAA